MLTNLSKLQKTYLRGLPMDISKNHELNVIAAIRKKFTDFDYFLVNFLDYPNTGKFKEVLESIEGRLNEYNHGNRD